MNLKRLKYLIKSHANWVGCFDVNFTAQTIGYDSSEVEVAIKELIASNEAKIAFIKDDGRRYYCLVRKT